MSKFTIQDIFLQYGDDYIKKHNLSNEQWKVFNAIRNCGTKNLGYHICTCEEFIRRFLLHILPDNFTKIKHYGLLLDRNKKNNIRLCRLLISRILTNEFISTISRKLHEFKCEKCGSTHFSYSFQYDIHRLSI